MSHLPFTIAAYFLNSIAVLIDKFLLSTKIPDPLIYVFYFSAFSLLALILLPFTPPPSLSIFLIASASTLVWTSGAYLMFKALQKGVASRVIPIIGTLIPLILLGYYGIFSHSISTNGLWAAGILTFGLFMLTAPAYRGKLILKELGLEVLSAGFFAGSYIILRFAYEQAPFLTVFAWSRLILIPVGTLIILIPGLRRKVFSSSGPKMNLWSASGALFLLGQICGGSAELLITFSIALASPALVNSLQGIQYIFLFLFSLILSLKYKQIYGERLSSGNILAKIAGISLVGFGLLVLSFSQQKVPPLTFGVTYSPRYASELKLDRRQTFLDSLNELNYKRLRFPLYWDEIEKTPGIYDFSEADFYLNEARRRQIEVVLTIGFKQPRWPECFLPAWALNIDSKTQDKAILQLLSAEVDHFKANPAVKVWQVENEPFLRFGVCNIQGLARINLLKQEVNLVKSLDTRPVLITDSGELSPWIGALNYSDYFGFTLYRVVGNPYLGQLDYPLFPLFYKLKAYLTEMITHTRDHQILISELQAEPWTNSGPLIGLPLSEQLKLFSLNQLKSNINFARETHFQTAYLWGLEWWYFLKTHGHPEYVQFIKSVF